MSSLAEIDWNQILNHLVSFATSSEGKDLLKQTKPLNESKEALKNFNKIRQAQTILNKGMRPFMESLDLYHPWITRLEKHGRLKTIELKDIRLFLIETESLREAMKESQEEWLANLYLDIMDPTEPLSAIEQLITPQAEIRIDASERLYNLHQEKKSQEFKVQITLNKLVKHHLNEPILQDKYVTTREGRWVIPIKSGRQHDINGIIHDSSATKQTVFMEPEAIIPLNNKIKQIDAEIENEIERLLEQISEYLQQHTEKFKRTKEILLKCDVVLAQAQLTNTLTAEFVEFDNAVFDLINVKHPIMVLSHERVIPNMVNLAEDERILLLSGPNAGGKTVLLKSCGLAAHMSRCGLPACVDKGSRMPFFKEIFVAVGDSQNIEAQMSTFAAHINLLHKACHNKGSEYLILVDEICGSTDPEEGAALARTFLKHYSQNKNFAIITSHLGPLKTGWEKKSGIVNGSMDYDESVGRSTFQFIKGIPGQSLAFSTAERLGVSAEFLTEAKTYLSPETRSRLQSINEIENLKQELTHMRAELTEKMKASQVEKENLKQQIIKFENERDALIEKELKVAREKIDEMIKKNKITDIFSQNEQRLQIQHDFPEIIKADNKPKEISFRDEKEFAKHFPPGSKVYIPHLQADGIVQGVPSSKGMVPILTGSMRLFVPWDKLKPPKEVSSPNKKLSRVSGIEVSFTNRGEEIDLRGKSVEEAVELLEQLIDSALANQHRRIKIVHGHGSEALKKAVRNHLSRSVSVNRWQVASENEGGDGVTWAYLLG